jgi:pentatricopeptide repeat protein
VNLELNAIDHGCDPTTLALDAAATSAASPPGGAWRLAKRDTALSIVDAFLETLPSLRTAADVAAAVQRTRDELHRAQGDPGDRAYFTRSISRLATATRRAGWAAVAADLLDWAIAEQLFDPFIFAEAVQCRATLEQWSAAEQTIAAARRLGVVSTAAYTSVLTAYAKLGWASRCRRVFDRADADGLTTGECYAALMKAYSHARCMRLVVRTFDRARGRHLDDVGCHLVLISAYGRTGRAGRARAVFELACERWPSEPRLYTAMIAAYCRNGMPDSAERVLRTAVENGRADHITFEVLVSWYIRRRERRRAERLIEYCARVGFATPVLTGLAVDSWH